MAIDSTKAAAAVSLISLIGLSLVLYSGSQSSGGERVEQPQTSPSSANGLPPDHPAVDVESAPLFDARLESIEARLAADGEDSGALLDMGQLMADAHRPIEAARYYERFLTTHPDSGAVWLYLANAYGTAGQWTESVDATTRMLVELPEHPGGLYNMGAALANQGRVEEARIWWQRAIQAGDPIIATRAEQSLDQLPPT